MIARLVLEIAFWKYSWSRGSLVLTSAKVRTLLVLVATSQSAASLSLTSARLAMSLVGVAHALQAPDAACRDGGENSSTRAKPRPKRVPILKLQLIMDALWWAVVLCVLVAGVRCSSAA